MMHDFAETVATPNDPPAKVPPLRIHHMLAATATTAVFLSFASTLRRDDTVGFSAFIASGSGVLYSVSTSLAITATCFGIAWRRRGIRFFHQPGHWLLVTQSLGLWVIILAAILLVVPNVTGPQLMPGLSLFLLALSLLTAGIHVWAAVRIADTKSWRVLFAFKAISLPMFHVLFLGMPPILLLIVTTAAVSDRRARRERDWPHWLGVWLAIAAFAALTVTQAFVLIAKLLPA